MPLVEIMVVVAIIGMIAGAVAVAVLGQFSDTQQKTVANDFKTIESQLDLYMLKKGSLPPSSEGRLKALVEAGISRELSKRTTSVEERGQRQTS